MGGFFRIMAKHTRREFVKGLAAGLVLANPLLKGCAAISNKIKEQIPKYQTITHDFLDIEEIGVKYSDYRTIDEIIYEAEKRIVLDARPPYSRNQALTVLNGIDLILKEKGFESEDGYLLNLDLKNKKLNCDSYSIIYLGIAEVLKLPLKAARAPAHVLVRWHFGENDYFNWETMRGTELPEEYYKERYKIDDISIKKRVFLSSFNREETLAIAYNNKGIALIKGSRYEEAVKVLDEGIKLNKRYPLLYFNKGAALEKLKRYEEAIENFEKVLEMDPDDNAAYFRKESCLYELKRIKIREWGK